MHHDIKVMGRLVTAVWTERQLGEDTSALRALAWD